MRQLFATIAVIIAWSAPPALAGTTVRAGTASGAVAGEQEGTVIAFRGIPYARAPTGSLRFKPAQPMIPWNDVRPALDFMPACPQQVEQDLTENNNSVMAEDCLGVNVWTPAVDARKRPVMVFIHGGAFIAGSARNSWYNGARLAARGDVVVVTLQYRLGAFGFLELGDIGGTEFEPSGNLGILDQVEALGWVQRNIAAFGGDPANVTLFGESVGATSVAILMGLPQADGLFAKAILESNSAARVGHERKYAVKLARSFMKSARVSSIEALQAMSMSQLRSAQGRFFEQVFGDSSFGPTWGDVLIPEPPIKHLLEGKGVKVPVLVGTNLDEIRFWSAIEELPLESKPEKLLKTQLNSIVGSRADAVIAAYKADEATLGDAILALETDLLFRMTSIRMAEAVSARQPTYMYLFTYRSTSPLARYGAAHSIEIPFVFGVLDDLDAIAFTGRDPRRHQLGAQIQDAWVRFARHGDPNHAGLPSWPRYELTRRATMDLGVESRVVDDPHATHRAAWDGVPFDNISPTGAQVSALLSENGIP